MRVTCLPGRTRFRWVALHHRVKAVDAGRDGRPHLRTLMNCASGRTVLVWLAVQAANGRTARKQRVASGPPPPSEG